MKLALAISFSLAVGIFASSAQAHNTDWYWSPARAEMKILNTGQAANAFNAEDVYEADCVGRGTRKGIDWIPHSQNPRQRLYRHFECYIAWTDYDGQDWEIERVLHVRGSQAFSLAAY